MKKPLILFIIGVLLIGVAFISKTQAATEPELDESKTVVEYTATQLYVSYVLKEKVSQSNRQIAIYQKDGKTPIGTSGVMTVGSRQGVFTVNTTYRGTVDVAVVQPLNTGGFVKSGSIQKVPVVAATGTTGTIGGTSGEKRFKDTLFAGPNNDALTAGDYLYRLYVWSVTIAILGATAVIIRAGYVYAVGRGNPSAVASAKELIVNALVGLALLILSYTILRFILGDRVKNQAPPSKPITMLK